MYIEEQWSCQGWTVNDRELLQETSEYMIDCNLYITKLKLRIIHLLRVLGIYGSFNVLKTGTIRTAKLRIGRRWYSKLF